MASYGSGGRGYSGGGIPASYAPLSYGGGAYDGLASRIGEYGGGMPSAQGACPRCGFGGYQNSPMRGGSYGKMDPQLSKVMAQFYKGIGEYYAKSGSSRGGK